MSKLKVLDLFSGIGGFSLGLERAGMETVAFCEIDKHCHKVLKKHWPQVPIFDDVKTLNKESLKELKIDVICGGFPCQDISVAGKKKGLIDENGKQTRSGLWFEYRRIINEIKPKYVIIENVANLRSNGLITVLQDLWAVGYCVEWHIISARSVGAPHLRERIWLIAHPDRERLDWARVLFKPQDERKGLRSARVCEELPNPDDFRLWRPTSPKETQSERWAKTALSVCDWWATEPAICRMVDGVPGRLDKGRRQRIKQLGNSVVPQIVELIGQSIVDYENEL